MKALCMVAHPDDCVIFGYSYMYHHSGYQWTVAYLTYTNQDPRGAELAAFWHTRNIPTMFLGYVDDYRDLERKQISFDTHGARQKIQTLIQDFDLVLSHDANGDYGHLHHVFVHDCVRQHPRLVTFAPPGQGREYVIPCGVYRLDELPTHRDIVAGFHRDQHRNCYQEPA